MGVDFDHQVHDLVVLFWMEGGQSKVEITLPCRKSDKLEINCKAAPNFFIVFL